MKPQNKVDEQKNGLSKPGIPDVKAVIKPAAQPEQRQPEVAKPTIEDRILKIEQLRSLSGKRQRTLNTLNDLRAFHFAADDTCTLILADSQNQKFQTGNSALITMLKNYLEALLNDKVSALDDEILGFKI